MRANACKLNPQCVTAPSHGGGSGTVGTLLLTCGSPALMFSIGPRRAAKLRNHLDERQVGGLVRTNVLFFPSEAMLPQPIHHPNRNSLHQFAEISLAQGTGRNETRCMVLTLNGHPIEDTNMQMQMQVQT